MLQEIRAIKERQSWRREIVLSFFRLTAHTLSIVLASTLCTVYPIGLTSKEASFIYQTAEATTFPRRHGRERKWRNVRLFLFMAKRTNIQHVAAFAPSFIQVKHACRSIGTGLNQFHNPQILFPLRPSFPSLNQGRRWVGREEIAIEQTFLLYFYVSRLLLCALSGWTWGLPQANPQAFCMLIPNQRTSAFVSGSVPAL